VNCMWYVWFVWCMGLLLLLSSFCRSVVCIFMLLCRYCWGMNFVVECVLFSLRLCSVVVIGLVIMIFL